MDIFQIIFGVSAIILAWALLFRSRLIFKFNAWMRDHVFSDNLVLFSGRRLAILFLVLGAIALFSGIERVTREQPIKSRISAKILEKAQNDFLNGDYSRVVSQCRELVRSNPENLVAQELLASALWEVGQKDDALSVVAIILEKNPSYPVTKGPLRKVFEKKRAQPE